MHSLNLFLALILFNGVCSFDWGDEATSCTRRMPANYAKMTDMKNGGYYKFQTSVDASGTFHPGQDIHIRIVGENANSKYTYEGIFLTIGQNGPEGVWQEFHSDKYKRLSCSQKENTAVVEANERVKFVEDDVFVWKAPDSCSSLDSMYELKGTVVKDSLNIDTGLSLKLKCVEKNEPPRKPILDACKVNYHAPFPNPTSFEDGFGGWWNSPTAALRWTRHKGKTPTMFTGPNKAFDGEYYAYSEASYPAKEGDLAILNSPPGLSGCLCIRFVCHMWSGPGTYFSARRNGVELWNHKTPGDIWLNGYASINDTNDPQVQLVMVRGSDFRGDIALDNISYHPGICAEDLM